MITLDYNFVGDMIYPVTRKRLVRMLRWFRNKGQTIKVQYQYNNSNGAHMERQHVGVLESFTVTTEDLIIEKDFVIKLKFKGDHNTVEETLSDYWEFTGLGQMQMCNSGPYCYFTVQFA